MIEKAVVFGSEGALVGVVCEPSADRALRDAPTFLLFNTGIHHKVGPYRFNVDLARALAAAGFASLRFDLSGLGDSALGGSGDDDATRQHGDLRAAMAFLEKRRAARTFVVVGFCSGVDAGFAVTVADERVVGAIFIEGYAYKTLGNRMRRPLRLLDKGRWERWIRMGAARYLPSSAVALGLDPQSLGRGPNVFARVYPTREAFARDVRLLSRRDVRTLFVYFGGDTDVSHKGQLLEMLGQVFLPRGIEIDFYADMDHIMFRPSDRARVVASIVRFATRELRERPAPLLAART